MSIVAEDKTEKAITNKEGLLVETELFVSGFFKKNIGEELLFHDFTHTREVVEAARKMAEDLNINEEEKEILLLSCWFHDCGYAKKREGHEEESVEIAKDFLQSLDFAEDKIEQVSNLIRSTQSNYQPQTLLEEIIHDADIAHIGKKSFFSKGELYRAELEACEDNRFTELDWQKGQFDFLLQHNFITVPGVKSYGSRRAKNIKKQRENIIKARKITRRVQTGKDFGRGIDTLYRSNYRNHINFSAIADGKANMMTSINTILISVIVTLSGASLSVARGFELESLRYTIPILTLLVSSLISVVFAVMSARPKVTEKEIKKKDIHRNKISLLYFGNFLEVSKEEFTAYLSRLKNDQENLYDSMSKDIYNLGIVLKTKYKLLTISYTVFMIGLTLCVLGFISIFIATNF